MKIPLAMVALIALAGPAQAADWVEGKHYFRVDTVPRTFSPDGEPEVVEVFSYGCPACNMFNSTARKIQQGLPPHGHFVYVHASFNTAEDWPMLQRAYYTAMVLGVVEKVHDRMFDAIWKTGELAVVDRLTGRPLSSPPTIEDAARFYNKVANVPVEKFLAEARGFTVDGKIRTAEEYMRGYKVVSTPTIIVNGKYRLDTSSAGGYEQVVELVRWLLAK
jgi:protein dithiol oxidoreductase (disulfide-forming)